MAGLLRLNSHLIPGFMNLSAQWPRNRLETGIAARHSADMAVDHLCMFIGEPIYR